MQIRTAFGDPLRLRVVKVMEPVSGAFPQLSREPASLVGARLLIREAHRCYCAAGAWAQADSRKARSWLEHRFQKAIYSQDVARM
jgi:hypothetical protein